MRWETFIIEKLEVFNLKVYKMLNSFNEKMKSSRSFICKLATVSTSNDIALFSRILQRAASEEELIMTSLGMIQSFPLVTIIIIS